jgi:hypothetical protein
MWGVHARLLLGGACLNAIDPRWSQVSEASFCVLQVGGEPYTAPAVTGRFARPLSVPSKSRITGLDELL